MNDVVENISRYADELTAIRRDIHRHPEAAYEEVRTAGLVATELRRLGIAVTEGVGRTGVVGTLKGGGVGQGAIGLRADMDCLNMEEQTGLAYASTIPGKMHACGHDGHTTMLLGAARYLAEHRESFGGTVHFIFQPAEEGHAGATAMIEDGLFDRFPCDTVYGLHNKPGIPLGHFAIRSGPMLAAADAWTVIFRGPGGHGGSGAHQSVDLSVVMAQFILAMQTIVARNVPAVETAVISVGYVGGGSRKQGNVLPSEMVVHGTARSYTPAVRDIIERRIGEIARGQAATYGADVEVAYKRGYPPTVNWAEQVGVAADVAVAVGGAEAVDRDAVPVTGAEDFSFMLERKKGAFMFIGNGEGSQFQNLHSPGYDFNDGLLPVGAAYWVGLVKAELGGA
jgi:hippurate hydrolase